MAPSSQLVLPPVRIMFHEPEGLSELNERRPRTRLRWASEALESLTVACKPVDVALVYVRICRQLWSTERLPERQQQVFREQARINRALEDFGDGRISR